MPCQQHTTARHWANWNVRGSSGKCKPRRDARSRDICGSLILASRPAARIAWDAFALEADRPQCQRSVPGCLSTNVRSTSRTSHRCFLTSAVYTGSTRALPRTPAEQKKSPGCKPRGCRKKLTHADQAAAAKRSNCGAAGFSIAACCASLTLFAIRCMSSSSGVRFKRWASLPKYCPRFAIS